MTDCSLPVFRSMMRRMRGRVQQLVASFVAAGAIAASTGIAPAQAQPKEPFPPMVFYVANGDADACGAGCREWIAADGMIDESAPARLRALLSRLGQRRLPIYF